MSGFCNAPASIDLIQSALLIVGFGLVILALCMAIDQSGRSITRDERRPS